MIKRYHAAIERKVIQSNSVSGFFKYVGGKLNSSHKVAPLHGADGMLLLSDADKAEAPNDTLHLCLLLIMQVYSLVHFLCVMLLCLTM